MRISRGELLLQSAKLAPALTAVVSSRSDSLQARKLKVVVTGGHPGDPECGCGGTAARYADSGHEVVLLYLNRGEGFCGRNDLKDSARLRTSEAEKACAILKARPVFVGQHDGRSVVDPSHYEEFLRVLNGETPDLVFTQ